MEICLPVFLLCKNSVSLNEAYERATTKLAVLDPVLALPHTVENVASYYGQISEDFIARKTLLFLNRNCRLPHQNASSFLCDVLTAGSDKTEFALLGDLGRGKEMSAVD
ncbi:hypothetical protein RvY_10751 [Ramazzottius varieornatus]|uniref:Uncharacterized protein n=1 Tax=Ramazzottius varieornatus TaxID=947166 RepID=A0A1D1VDS7_RAMVA|nr:hypothetical protein RvY_10751 [Ramazzottius varieornatus]